MLRRVLFLLPVMGLIGCTATVPPLTSPLKLSFAEDAVGAPPAHFTEALTGGGGAVKWIVRTDATAPTPKVLQQESADDTSYRFPLCIYNDAIARDVSAEVKFKAIAGTTDQAAGIVLRYSKENYYVARANALEDNVNLFKTVNGKRSKLIEVPARVAPSQWHTLRFTAIGSRLTVIFDGAKVIETNDATFPTAGKIGLWTKADSVVEFADLKVEPEH